MRVTAVLAGKARPLLSAFIALYLLFALAPWIVAPPARGIESSWQQIIGRAAAEHWQWGRDILFTYGPLGYMRFPVAGETPLAPQLVWSLLLIAIIVAAVLYLLRGLTLIPALAYFVVFAVAAAFLTGHGVYAMLPLLAALVYFKGTSDRMRTALLITVGCAINAAGYAPGLMAGVVILACLDVEQLRNRAPPVFVPSFAVVLIAVWLASGQSLEHLPRFLRSIVELGGGYDEAMAIDGPPEEALGFLIVSAIAGLWVTWRERHRVEAASRLRSLLLFAVLALAWFLAWKSGFVRHDLHSVIAWSLLSLIILAYGAVDQQRAPSLANAMITLSLAVIAAVPAVYRYHAPGAPAHPWQQIERMAINQPRNALRSLTAMLASSTSWAAFVETVARAGRAEIVRNVVPIPTDKSVSVTGGDQAMALAQSTRYVPLPVFQPYAAYTPWLQQANREFLQSGRAPEVLFLSGDTIDNRYPYADLGRSMQDTLSRYRATEVVGDYLRLERTGSALDLAPAAKADTEARVGEWTAVPVHAGIVFADIDARPSVMGRLRALLWHARPISLTVRLRDGSEHTHRLIPRMAASGFMLSPYVALPDTLARQLAGRLPREDASRVIAFRVDDGQRGVLDDRLVVRFTELTLGGPAQHPELARMLDRRDMALRLAGSLTARRETLEARGAVLFAHAPSAPEIVLARPSRVHVRYGIYPDAWQGTPPGDGVCFRIRVTPLDNAGTSVDGGCVTRDAREERELAFSTPPTAVYPATVTFETDCRANCAYDWSYWKNIDIDPPPGDAPASTGGDPVQTVLQLARAADGTVPKVEARGSLLFAHAPTITALDVPRLHAMRVRYGLLPDAYAGDRQPDTVCFRIALTAQNKTTRTLLDRCLSPAQQVADRGDQTFARAIDLNGPARLTFETRCRSTCAWAWSYWKDPALVP